MIRLLILAGAAVVAVASFALDGGKQAPVRQGTIPVAATVQSWVPTDLVVGFWAPPAAHELAALRTTFPAIRAWRELPYVRQSVRSPLGTHPLAKVRVATVPPGTDIPELARAVAATPGVRYAEPNHSHTLAFVPNDPLYPLQYGPQKIGAECAWDITTGDASVIVAVADTGINFGHEDFQGATWVNPGEIPDNGIDDDGNGFVDDWRGWDFATPDNNPTDGHGHGSHVAGTIGARLNNGIGIAGLGNFTLMPLQAFTSGGSGNAAWFASAVYYATDMGANCLNYSGGGSGSSQTMLDAVEYAHDNGMTVVAAAGNYSTSSPFYPAFYPTVIAVSATDSGDSFASYSDYGNWVDVSAPGSSVYSCWHTSPSAYNTISGTSMATPHCTGLVALIYSLMPDLTPDQVRYFIQANADDLGTPGYDVYYGHGRINACGTLSNLHAIWISFPNGLPDAVPPNQGYTIDVRIETVGENVVTGTEKLYYRIGTSGPYSESLLTPVGGGMYEAVLPGQPCGETIEYYFAVMGDGGTEVGSPDNWPTAVYSVPVGVINVVFADDFETDIGWTVENSLDLTDGAWGRGVPVGGGDRGDPATAYGGSGACFLTDNTDGNSDVDGGTTWLISPPLDLAGKDAYVRYARWYDNSSGNAPFADEFIVWVSNDDGASWEVVETVGPGGLEAAGGWHVRTFRVSEFVTPTSQVRVRFEASDLNDPSVVEAGVDAFLVWEVVCAPAGLSGVVELQQIAVSPAGREVTIEFRDPGTQTVVASYNATLDGSGAYTIPDVMEGTFDLSIKHANWLRRTLANQVVSGAAVAAFSLVNGDADGDNEVTLLDVNTTLAGFGGAGAGDLDANGTVELLDLNIALTNFGAVGDT